MSGAGLAGVQGLADRATVDPTGLTPPVILKEVFRTFEALCETAANSAVADRTRLAFIVDQKQSIRALQALPS